MPSRSGRTAHEYTFDVFLEKLDGNWYEHDPLLQHLISRYAGAAARVEQPAVQEWGCVRPVRCWKD